MQPQFALPGGADDFSLEISGPGNSRGKKSFWRIEKKVSKFLTYFDIKSFCEKVLWNSSLRFLLSYNTDLYYITFCGTCYSRSERASQRIMNFFFPWDFSIGQREETTDPAAFFVFWADLRDGERAGRRIKDQNARTAANATLFASAVPRRCRCQTLFNYGNIKEERRS